MRLIYLGSGEFGLPTLEALASRHEVVAVVTQPDRPAGRHRHLTPTPVGAWAEASPPLSQPRVLLKPSDANDPSVIALLADLRADAAVVIAFGQKLSPALIEALGRLTINLHASLLPRWRGAAPINHAIMAGDTDTGLSVIALAQRMDAGVVYGQSHTPINSLETAGELHDRLALMGPSLVLDVLDRFERGQLHGEVQDDTLATRAGKLSKADAVVDFTQPATIVQRRIHGLTPWPGIHITWRRAADGKQQELLLRRVEVEVNATVPPHVEPGTMIDDRRIACGEGVLRLLEVQSPGKRPMTIDEFVRGHPLHAGDRLES